ncbi:MAG: hypothetical protein N2203_07900 [Bacteroidia bacterium]|nr:hypothetical protein [Bacteroidia bacterium]
MVRIFTKNQLLKKFFRYNSIFCNIFWMLIYFIFSISCNRSDSNKDKTNYHKEDNLSTNIEDTCFKGIMMINEQAVLCILDSASPQNASTVMQKNYEKILEDVRYTECSVAEQPGCIFYFHSPDKIVFETFMFLKAKPKRQPKTAKPVILEQTLAILYDHYGSFNTIHQSYDKIQKMIEQQGYKQSGPVREVYVIQEDTSRWRTRIIVPIIKK